MCNSHLHQIEVDRAYVQHKGYVLYRALVNISTGYFPWLKGVCSAQDFVVTEIDSKGRLVQLDRFSPPPPPSPPNHTHPLPSHTSPSVSVPTTSTDEVPLDDELTTEVQSALSISPEEGGCMTEAGPELEMSKRSPCLTSFAVGPFLVTAFYIKSASPVVSTIDTH